MRFISFSVYLCIPSHFNWYEAVITRKKLFDSKFSDVKFEFLLPENNQKEHHTIIPNSASVF